MRHILLLIAFISVIHISKAQVGINTTDPKAQLDIEAGTTPSEMDGLLIPRLDEYPTGVGLDQDGMLVFITGDGSPAKGFYYWDEPNTNWVAFINPGGGTLDQAYDFGGAGTGKTILATNGAVAINGEDGLVVSGIIGSGNNIDTDVSGPGTRLFFNPNKSAFRAGTIDGTQWNDVNIGNNSTALGNNTMASGNQSIAFGDGAIASGEFSIAGGQLTQATAPHAIALGNEALATAENAIALASGEALANYAVSAGRGTRAYSYSEVSIGLFNRAYAPNSTTTFDGEDRIFNVGNGTGNGNRSDAFTILKNGKVGFGNGNPQNPLSIGQSTPWDLSHQNTGQDGIHIIGGDDNSGENSIGGSISFGPSNSTRKAQRKSAIAAIQTGGDIDFMGLAFFVHENGINTSPMVEGMRLTHNRRLGINNTDPSANLDVIGTLQYEDGNEATGYVLTSDADGNASWTDPASISLPMTLTNLSYPEGFTGMTPIILQGGGLAYTVPTGKNCYITNIYSDDETNVVSVDGKAVQRNRSNLNVYTPITQPIIVGAGEEITRSNANISLNGFLVDNNVTPITQEVTTTTSYTVPTGKSLVILSGANRTGTSIVIRIIADGAILFDGIANDATTSTKTTSFQNPIVLPSGTVLSSSNSSIDYHINGYLIDN